MKPSALSIVAVLALILSAALASAQTNLVVNGSFESGLTNWTFGQVNETNASGTCSYNGATAPGTETLTSTPGFPATDGTAIALGSVSSTSGSGSRTSCTLYQDIAIPAGATAVTLKFDAGAKAGVDGCRNTGAFIGLYSTSAVPGIGTPTVGGAVTSVCLSSDAATLATSTVNKTASVLAGTTIRLAFINAANVNGHEVLGLDNVQLLVTIGAPTVTSVTPSSGPTTGGNSVTIAGTGFTGATSVTFAGVAATSFSVVNTTTITATVPAGTAGTASVIVTTPAGSNAANTLYTYVAPPTVTAIDPSTGPVAGGNTVTIIGTGFTGATSVTFAGAAATNFTVVSATTIMATVPPGTAGTASVIVTTPAGSNAANTLYAYVVAIPTLGEWGMIGLAAALVLFGLRRLGVKAKSVRTA